MLPLEYYDWLQIKYFGIRFFFIQTEEKKICKCSLICHIFYASDSGLSLVTQLLELVEVYRFIVCFFFFK